jgi:peptidylprolyl isomerase/peptidyl-prolyl cis-trans isomerase C
MQRSELDQDSLAAAIERDLRVEAILEKVAANLEAVTSIDAEIYYRLHPEAFNSPEARHLQHILITFDNDHQKTKALLQLELLRTSLNSIESFGAAALRHSQCPTAVNAGDLGIVKRKQLYVELETAAFALSPGEISEVLESPIGLHIIRCEKIHAGGIIPFADVREKIIERLTDKRRQEAQKNWIKSLASQKQKTSTLLTT